MRVAKDVVKFSGHWLITARHQSTFEITTEDFLGPKGDCIIGINSSKSCYDLDNNLKELLKNDDAQVNLIFLVDNILFEVRAFGSSKLSLTDKKSMVIRKSSYTCPRTLAIKATASAKDFPSSMISLLRRPECRGVMIIESKVSH
ncbi:MAG: DUF371 domain-containing protein [Nitrososphaeria archaeon]